MAAVDITDLISKILENSTIGACLLFVYLIGIRFLEKRDKAMVKYLEERDRSHNQVIREIVERMDRRDEQMQTAIGYLKDAVSELTVAVERNQD